MVHSRVAVVGLVVSLAVVLGADRVGATSSWRCGARLVGVGQTTADVYDLCGEPTDRRARTEYVTVRVSCDVAVTRPVLVEEWLYDRGPKRFQRFLRFRDGTLVDIDEGSYGY